MHDRGRNQAPSWRWGRTGTVLAILAAAMLASGVATTAWHLARSDGEPRRAPLPVAATAARPAPTTSPSPAGRRVVVVSAPAKKPAPHPTGESRSPGPASPPKRTATPEARPYGPWQCEQALQFSAGGNPVLAGACHALGPRVQVRGTLAAPPGGIGTIALSIRDASSGRAVATPRTCAGLVFADRQVTRDCGPASVSLPHGRTYVVVMSWTYAKDAAGARGTQNGATFAW